LNGLVQLEHVRRSPFLRCKVDIAHQNRIRVRTGY
jgi:hypothetical protein